MKLQWDVSSSLVVVCATEYCRFILVLNIYENNDDYKFTMFTYHQSNIVSSLFNNFKKNSTGFLAQSKDIIYIVDETLW